MTWKLCDGSRKFARENPRRRAEEISEDRGMEESVRMVSVWHTQALEIWNW